MGGGNRFETKKGLLLHEEGNDHFISSSLLLLRFLTLLSRSKNNCTISVPSFLLPFRSIPIISFVHTHPSPHTLPISSSQCPLLFPNPTTSLPCLSIPYPVSLHIFHMCTFLNSSLFIQFTISIIITLQYQYQLSCVCACVCVGEREREL